MSRRLSLAAATTVSLATGPLGNEPALAPVGATLRITVIREEGRRQEIPVPVEEAVGGA